MLFVQVCECSAPPNYFVVADKSADNYYLSFPKDPLYMKVTVYSSFILELLQTALVTHDTWEIFANNFGDMAGLNNLRFLWFTLPILGGIGE